MMLLLFIFYWIVIPVLGLMVTLWLFSLAKSALIKLLVVASFVAALWGYSWMMWGEQEQVDKQVRELCAKDGGAKVYETVQLTPDLLDWAGRIAIPIAPYTKLKDTDKYYMDWKTTYLKEGNPSLRRDDFRIIRRSDGKLLGESVTYGRGGGDLPGPWHETAFTCPDPTKSPGLEKMVFVKGNK